MKKLWAALSIIGTILVGIIYLLGRKPIVDRAKTKIKQLKKHLDKNDDRILKLKEKEQKYKGSQKTLEKKITAKIREISK